jgi:hypothetical protein
VLDRHDEFWPVPVRTVFAMHDRHRRVCRRIDDRDPNVYIRVNTQADVPWIGGESESLELPASNDVASQRRIFVDALGSIDPRRTAMEYFLTSGGGSPREPVSLQYWFFYTYNRQRLPGGVTAGRHQGDFESVGVLLSSRDPPPALRLDGAPRRRGPGVHLERVRARPRRRSRQGFSAFGSPAR